MDQYGSHNGVSASYNNNNSPSASAIAPSHLQQQTAAGSLPSLTALQQGAHIGGNGYVGLYGQPITAPHTPSTSQPGTPGSAGTGGFPSMSSQPTSNGYRPQGNYQQSLPQYSSGSMMSHTSAMSHQQTIAPTPSLNQAPRSLVALRPMQTMNMSGMGGMSQGMGYGPPQGMMQPEEQPTHVVGAQGRRGILPSAPGKPPVTMSGPGATKNAAIPPKDENGKFPCPHCAKTYLHAKHLKRHLLRHTGDRPYMCILCKDTFSRSDILKRHFSKCSIRRGNPTGATHLSHAQAHLKNQPKHKSSPSSNGIPSMDSLMPGGPAAYPFGVIPGSPDKADGSSPHNLSRANSIKLEVHEARNMNGHTPNGSNRTSFDGSSYHHNIPTTMANNIGSTLHNYSMSNVPSGSNYPPSFNFPQPNGIMPQNGGGLSRLNAPSLSQPYGNGQQWNNSSNGSYFQPGAQDRVLNFYNTSLGLSQVQSPATAIRNNFASYDSDSHLIGLYPTHHQGSTMQSVPSAVPDISFQRVAARIINFCSSPTCSSITFVRQFFSAENVVDFFDNFKHFDRHFPVLHMPTFCPEQASDSRLTAMACIGAVYSHRTSPDHVRNIMEEARLAMEKKSSLAQLASDALLQSCVWSEASITTKRLYMEDLQASWLMQVLFTWHGNPIQREQARRKFGVLVRHVHSLKMQDVSATPDFSSMMHQPTIKSENVKSAAFDWEIWVEQETRSRLFYAIFTLDAAMAIFFNMRTKFDSTTITLPLPANDAAWDAKTSDECAAVLGLRLNNCELDSNSRPIKQREMNIAMANLLAPEFTFDIGSTNLFSMFILFHDLLARLHSVQYRLCELGESSIVADADSLIYTHNAEELKVIQQSRETMRTILFASGKWKRAWDRDMAVSPPKCDANTSDQHRMGFCRDAIHFYFLGHYLSQNKLDFRMAPDQRLGTIMNILKHVRQWAISDSAARGEELGSVSDIGPDYGVASLTLDMAQLFKPIVRGAATGPDGFAAVSEVIAVN